MSPAGTAAMLALALAPFCLATDLASAAARELLSKKQRDALELSATGARILGNCRSLSETDKREYVWHVNAIIEYIEAAPEHADYTKLVDHALEVGDHASCNTVGQAIAQAGLMASRRLNFELTGGLYLERPHDPFGDSFRLQNIAMNVGVEERCKYRDAATRRKFVTLYEAASKKIAGQAKKPEEALSSFDGMRKRAREDTKSNCAPEEENIVTDAYIDAHVLNRQLRIEPVGGANSGR